MHKCLCKRTPYVGMSSPVCHWCFKCAHHLRSPCEHLWLQALEISCSGGIHSPGSDNWAQPQTLVALDAELVGISLLHENDQNLKRKPGHTKKRKLLKRLIHLKKKKKNYFCICHSERTSCFTDKIHPKGPVMWDPRPTNQWGAPPPAQKSMDFRGACTNHLAGADLKPVTQMGNVTLVCPLPFIIFLAPPSRALANLYFPCTKRENGYSRCL